MCRNFRQFYPGPRDAAALVELFQLREDSGASEPTALEIAEASLSSNPTEEVYLAEVDGSPVGFPAVQVTSTFYSASPTGELTEQFVRPDNRRAGVASTLIKHTRQRCETLGVDELFLRVNRKNGMRPGDPTCDGEEGESRVLLFLHSCPWPRASEAFGYGPSSHKAGRARRPASRFGA